MLNLIQADLFKLYKSKAIKVLFAMTTLGAVAMTTIAYLIVQGKLDSGMSGIGFMFSDINMISILGAVIAGTFICGDFDNKTIHSAIASGCSRSVVIISKAIVFFCAVAFILLPYAIITVIALISGVEFSMGATAVGFLNIITSNAAVTFSVAEMWKLLAIMLTLIIVYISQLSICILLAFIFKKPVSVVGIYYGISIFFAQMTEVRAKFEIVDNVFKLIPYGGSYSLLNLNSFSEDMIKAIVISIIFSIAMLVVSYITFKKVEIK